jgi:hypothetical protein
LFELITAEVTVARRMGTAQQPLVVAKLYLDGHEEPIRGPVSGMNPAAFKDIAAESSDQNFLTVSRRPSPNSFKRATQPAAQSSTQITPHLHRIRNSFSHSL